MIVGVAEVFLRENLSFVLQALCVVVASGNLGSILSCLNFLTLVMLRDDILLDTFLNSFAILAFHSPLVSFDSAI